ncbi:TPA: hypothetical protein N3C02_004215 [Vibrio parahaemolyticus]|uniref:hypothetical protein n=1 Tax=Vibrio parahaemolyticus TaxID=670 RepID=UPI001302C129|nr:hypothetical protein [Vibrio parahaemolyticus]MCC3820278.1 hypothetical protein [Vibrio parahaemolyticus]MDF4597257.1 hypothetical protein [Vibrio parahaemolyticus]HAS6725986.1 hypothetical protein [Vibrio parahaemolyticus]HAS6783875.1 hypothetical protein [Vibrio parahaemolyticus]HAS6793740.1 hypothetical protein [Vibrio parahaemolyticus]
MMLLLFRRVLIFLVLVLSLCSYAETVKSRYLTDWEFRLYQLQYQLKNIEKLSSGKVDESSLVFIDKTLSEHGFNTKLFSDFGSFLLAYSSGDLMLVPESCESLSNLVIDTSSDARAARFSSLAEDGARIFNSFVEMKLLASAAQVSASERADNADAYDKICQRVLALQTAFRPLSETPADFDAEAFNSAVSRVFPDAQEVVYFDAKGLELKAAFFRYLPTIFHQLNLPISPLRKELESALAGDSDVKKVGAQVKNIVIRAIEVEAYIQLFDVIEDLPLIALDHFGGAAESELKTEAKAARKFIEQVEFVKDGEQIKRAKSDVAQLFASHQVIIHYVDAVNSKLQSLASQPRWLNDVDEVVDEAKNYAGEHLCSELEQLTSDADMGPFAWGKLPTKQKPVGYRFTAVEDQTKRRSQFDNRQLYKVRLEILVRMPEIEYLGDCPNAGNVAFKAIDTGVVIDHVIRAETVDSVSKGFRRLEVQVNTIISNIQDSRRALNSLGLLGDWVNNAPYWVISDDFKKVDMILPLREVNTTVPLIDDGQVVLDLKQTGLAMCYTISSQVLPGVLEEWVAAYRVPIADDWSLTLKGQGSAAINVNNCSAFYESISISTDALPALASAELAVEMELVLSGAVNGARFDWVVDVYANVLNDEVTVRGFQFETPPQVLVNQVDVYKQQLIDDVLGDIPVDIDFLLDAPGYIEQLSDFTLPLALQVSTLNCAAESIQVGLHMPDFGLTISDDALKDQVEGLARCEGTRMIADVLDQQLSCDSLRLDLFGINVDANEAIVTAVQADTLIQCRVSVDTTVANHPIKLRNILMKVTDDGPSYDFSEVKDQGTFTPFVETEIKRVLGDVAKQGLLLTNARFSKNAFLVDVTLDRPGLFGKISFGTLTMHASGRVLIDAELERIFRNRVASVLESKLETLARKTLPKQVERLDIVIEFPGGSGQLEAGAVVDLRLNEKFVITGKIDLLPNPDLAFKFDEAAIKNKLQNEMASFLEDYVKFSSGPIQAGIKEVTIAPNYDVLLGAFVNIKLDALGELKADPIYISQAGVKFGGRLEVRVSYALPLIPVPLPVFLVRPGVFYDFDKDEVGALGALTIVAPPLAEILQIDASLTTDDPERFLQKLILEGNLIVLNSVPFLQARGGLDFKNAQVTFDGQTGPILQRFFSASMRGALKPQEELAEINTRVTIFDVELSKTALAIYVNQCPERCIKGTAAVDLGIGSGEISAEFGPFIVDGLIEMEFKLTLFGKELGNADFKADVTQAKLRATVFDALTFGITTPSKKEMTPEYIAAVIASLLNIDLKDILKWLENPENLEIKLAPAGEPQSGEGGGDDGGSDGAHSNGGGDTGDGGGSNPCCTVPPTDEELRDTSQSDVLDDAPPSRNPSVDGNSAAACDFRYKSWGFVTKWSNRPQQVYYPREWLSDEAFDTICVKRNKPGNLQTWGGIDVYYIDDNYRLLETVARHYNSREPLTLQKQEDERSYYASQKLPVFNVRYTHPKDGEQPRSDGLAFRGRDFEEVVTATQVQKTVSIDILNADLKRFQPYIDALNQAGDSCSLDQNRALTRHADRTIKRMVADQTGYRPSCFVEIDKPFFSGWFSNTTTLKIKIDTAMHSETHSGYERFYFWLNRYNDTAVFERRCFNLSSSKLKGDCFVAGESATFDEMNQRAIESLRVIRSTVEPNKVLQLNMDETDRFLNDAVPYILTGHVPPEQGIDIPLDSKVANCDVTHITLTEDQDRLKFRARVSNDRESQFKNITVEKLGQHAYWANSKKKSLINAMANFLVCEEQPKQWLQNHRMWLEYAEHERASQPLLFYRVFGGGDESYPITDIQRGQSVARYTVPKFNPYFKTSGISLLDESKDKLYKLVSKQDGARVDIYVNQSQRIELLELQLDGLVRFELRRFACVDYDTGEEDLACDNALPLQGIDEFNGSGPISLSTLQDCLAELPSNPKVASVKALLAVDNPSHRFGIGPVRLLRALSANKNLSCGVTP